MVGMFTVVKVREGRARGDDRDPGCWYKHPAGTLAYEWTGASPPVARAAAPGAGPKAMSVGKGAGGAHR